MGKEKGPEFYTGKGYLKEGAFEHNMAIYEEAIKLLPSLSKYNKIIELGCGIGYFALLVKKYKYIGIDFSVEVIKKARYINQTKVFIVENLLSKTLYKELYTNDCIYVCLEVLEHIDNDIDVIKSIPSGSPIIISVPNRDYDSHVRYYKNQRVIIERYQEFIDFHKCKWTIIETNPKKGAKVFMFRARRK